MNLFEASVIIQYNWGWDTCHHDPEWYREMIDLFVKTYKNKAECYADGHAKPYAAFWRSDQTEKTAPRPRKENNHPPTHRCAQRPYGASIRWDGKWELSIYIEEYDEDYGTFDIDWVSSYISYCPFCGEKLDEPIK